MTYIALILFAMVLLGLARDRLGRSAYVILAVVVLGYVTYVYLHPQ